MNTFSISIRTLRSRAWRAALAAILMANLGCGYSLEGTRRPASLSGARTINISIFRDETGEPNLGFLMAQSVRNRFLNDGRLLVVNAENADISLDAVVREYRLDPIGFSRSDLVQRYRVLINTSIRLRDLRSGKQILNQNIATDSEFNLVNAVAGSAANRDATNKKAADFFAEELLSLILEGF